MLEAFHFLRPLWLLALIPTAVFYAVIRARSPERQWRRIIAPHLLEHLKVGGDAGFRFRPIHLITLLLTLGSAALAGPTWKRERSPFAEDTASLVLALDLSQSMNAIDVRPSRLERGKQKIRDLLELRKGARTALVAYAGSAHTVLPLSDDASILEIFLSSLETGVMPLQGKEPSEALQMAEELLSREETPGSILFLTDGIARAQLPAFVEHESSTDNVVMVLAIGTRDGGPIRAGENTFATDDMGRRMVATLDVEGLEALASETGAFIASATADNADVRRLERRIQSHLRDVQEADETARWRDYGYYFTFPIVLLSMLWFRKGWTVRFSIAVVFLLPGCAAEVWLTPDQQGRLAFERGDYAEASERFSDPMWQGAAFYRAGDYERALDAFARVDSAEAYFDLGNSYAALENYEQAIASYDTALERRPDWTEARENLELVRALIPPEPEGPEDPPTGGEPSLSADEVQFDDKADQGTRGEVEMSALTDDQLAEMWMRRLSTSPADFLRRRFAMEAVPR